LSNFFVFRRKIWYILTTKKGGVIMKKFLVIVIVLLFTASLVTTDVEAQDQAHIKAEIRRHRNAIKKLEGKLGGMQGGGEDYEGEYVDEVDYSDDTGYSEETGYSNEGGYTQGEGPEGRPMPHPGRDLKPGMKKGHGPKKGPGLKKGHAPKSGRGGAPAKRGGGGKCKRR